jgi:hypothetical protein
MPFNATIFNACLVSVLGCIYVGSTTAFNAFVGSFVLMSSASYTAAILPNLLTGRKNIVYGPFKLKGWLGPVFSAVACGYMVVWFVIYCFPFALPTSESSIYAISSPPSLQQVPLTNTYARTRRTINELRLADLRRFNYLRGVVVDFRRKSEWLSGSKGCERDCGGNRAGQEGECC